MLKGADVQGLTAPARGDQRPMTPLRRRMIEDMRIRNFSDHTIAAYVSAVYRLANYYHRSDRQSLGQIALKQFEQSVPLRMSIHD
jgi:hypothetical protein